MRTYRMIWGVAVALASAVAFLSCRTLGAWNLAGACLVLPGLGLVFGLAWAEGDGRWAFVARCTLWSGVAGLLLVGLPTMIGSASLVVLPVLAAGAPPLVEQVWGRVRARRPVPAPSRAKRLSDRDLARRWRRTSEELRRGRLPVAVVLRLVQERELLLGELERRDPDGFEAQLVQAGWHSAHPAADL